MILKTTNAAGRELVFSNLYALYFTSIIQGGPSTCDVSVRSDGPRPGLNEKLEIFDGMTRIWLGRVEDEPEVVETGELFVTAVGYASHLKDRQIKRLYVDTSYDGWLDTPPVENTATEEWDGATRVGGHQLFVRLDPGNDVGYSTALRTGFYYDRANHTAINQDIYSVEYDYDMGVGYNGDARPQWQLRSYTQDLTSSTLEVGLAGSDFTNGLSGSVNDVTTASRKALTLYFRGDTSAVDPYIPGFWTYSAKITNMRVNGLAGFTSADTPTGIEVIKDIIENFTSLSQDYARVMTGTVELTHYVIDDPTELVDIINEALTGEDAYWSIEDTDSTGVARMSVTATNRTTPDWYAYTSEAPLDLAGRSIQDMYNQVVIEFQTVDGRERTTTRTASDASVVDPFAADGLVKEARIAVETNNTAVANSSGDAFLKEYSRYRARGETIPQGTLLHRTRGRLPAWHVKPGELIQFVDVDATPRTLDDLSKTGGILNGRNLMRVSEMSADPVARRVILQVDNSFDAILDGDV